jgi:hypothetical protein
MPESVRSTGSITNEKDALQRKLKPPANVERFKKTLNFGEIVRIMIRVAHCYRKMKNIVHHARLKNILEKLIVVNGSACLDFKNPPFASRMGVSVETLQYLALPPKKHGHDYLVLERLPLLDPKSELL